MGFIGMYLKRHGLLATLLSFVCLAGFFMAIIPADAVLTADPVDFSQKQVGGVKASMPAIVVSYDESVPRNVDGERLVPVGRFKVTHYCACTVCTWGSGITASGKPVAEGMIAADWGVLPRGTKVYIKRGNSVVAKIVEDRGGAINGKIIDVYVPSHEYALQLGVYYADLYVDPGVELS